MKNEHKSLCVGRQISWGKSCSLGGAPGKAKALLAAEHDREFTEMRVSRVPWADKYGDSKRIPAKELLSHGWWLYCSNCGTQVYDDEATVLTEETVLCAECAKDWSEEK